MHYPNKLSEPVQPSTNVEKAIVGSVLLDQSYFDSIGDAIAESDFFDPELGRLFHILRGIHDSGQSILDPVLLRPTLVAMGLPEHITSYAHLVELLRIVPYAHNAPRYAEEIRRASRLRGLQQVADELASRTTEDGVDPAKVAEWLDARLLGVGRSRQSPVKRVDAIADEFLESLRNPPEQGEPIMSGLLDLDRATGGFAPGELVILAARPGVGKTALATQIVKHNASYDRSALLVSLEMSDRELISRILCGMAGVDSRVVRGNRASVSDIQSLSDAASELGEDPAFVWSPTSTTVSAIRAIAKQHAAISGLRLLVVDYLQLVRPSADERKMQRHEQVASFSGALKILARELKVPVLCLAQLNREADGQEPKLSHLRESGSIEQDADMVLFLHKTKDATRTEDGRTDLIIGKHRHGEVGAIELAWHPATTSFSGAMPQEWKP